MQNTNNIPDILVRLFDKELPGYKAQQNMLAKPLKPLPKGALNADKIPSAVLILIYPTEDELRFILTKRTEFVDHHKGQISLPGGVMNRDESLNETALRETMEEIGIDPNLIDIFGNLSPLHVKVSGFEIHPFVGWIDHEPVIVPSPQEVEDVISVSLGDLLDDNNLKEEEWAIRGYPVRVPYFQFNQAKVWGATAMILAEFKQVLKQIK